ncbi:MAG: hypothetical protein HYV63_25120 [Candidatus Schekmanbacteria bacterium]|nr:hypothetical protein [Candidatus Schekmanbacteria bacterium]
METLGLELELRVLAGSEAEAILLADQAVRLFPASPRVRLLGGRAMYRAHRYEEALDHFRESARLRPHWMTERWIGKTLTQLGRYDEAEACLRRVRDRSVGVLLDQAWLYQREGRFEQARAAVQAYLEVRPDDRRAHDQLAELGARALTPEARLAELEAMEEAGMPVPEAMFPPYAEGLLAAGQSRRLRAVLAERRAELSPRTVLAVAWACYKASQLDVACDLFLSVFAANAGNVKLQAALEAAARRCGRLDDVMRAYEVAAPAARPLYGRLTRLRRQAGAATRRQHD